MSFRPSHEYKTLQDRIRELERQVEEKDETNFELGATIASIQAEAAYKVQSIEKETKLLLDRTQEELRRATQDANKAHMALARLQKSQNQQRQEPAQSQFSPPPPTAQLQQPQQGCETGDVPSTIFVASIEASPLKARKSGAVLARHLLLCCPPIHASDNHDSIRMFLQHAQHSQLGDTDVVWQIIQSCHENGCNNLWIKEGLKWSASSRSMLRRGCLDTDLTRTKNSCSRIQVSANLESVLGSLKNPLWIPGDLQREEISSRSFDPRVCKEWMNQVCSEPDDWNIISTLMQDCSSVDEQEPWFHLISEDIIPIWEAFARVHLLNGRPRRVHKVDASQVVVTIDAFLQSVTIMTEVFQTASMKLAEEHSVMAIMLDLLENETVLKTGNMKLIVIILAFLSSLCETAFGMKLVRTRMTNSEDDLAQSGLGVAILVLTAAQLQLESLIDKGPSHRHSKEYWELEMMRNHVVRLFHQVLRHVQIGKSNKSDSICFSSLIEERQHDYSGVCSQILVAPKDCIDPSILSMVRLQMEELELDREDEEDLKLRRK